MPTDQITLAAWQAMDTHEVKAHIAAGVFPPIMGGSGEGDEGGTGGETPKEKTEEEPKAPEGGLNVDGLKKALDEERTARKQFEQQVKDLKPKAEAHDQLTEAQKTELQKAQDDLTAAQQTNAGLIEQIRAANLRSALADQKHGLASPGLAAMAVTAAGIEFDESNRPVGLDDAVKAVTESEPALLAGKPPAPTGNGGEGGGTSNVTLTAEELEAAKASEMTPEEYVAFRDNTPLPEQSGT